MNVTDEILHYLPHRYPFLLVDRVLEFMPGKSLVALKNVTHNEPFFPGHFPGDPVMPGVLIIEAMAQAACLMTLKSEQLTAKIKSNIIYLVGIDEARFKQMVKPGDQLLITTEFMWRRNKIWRAKCTAAVKDEIVCSAELTGAWGDKG